MATKFIRVRGRVVPIRDKGDVSGQGYHEVSARAQKDRRYAKNASKYYSKEAEHYKKQAKIGRAVAGASFGVAAASLGASSILGTGAKTAKSVILKNTARVVQNNSIRKLITKSRFLGKAGLVAAGIGAVALLGSAIDSKIARSSSSNARNLNKMSKKNNKSSV